MTLPKLRLLIPVGFAALLALLPKNARAVAPGPFYHDRTAGAYYFHLPLDPGGKYHLGVRELIFSTPIATGKKSGRRLSVGVVGGRAGVDEIKESQVDFGKLALTLHGIRLGNGTTFEVGVRGKIYREKGGRTTGGGDVGLRARMGGAKAEAVVYDLLRPAHDVIYKASGSVPLPKGFSISGTVNTESRDPTVAVSTAFRKKGVMVFPEVGIGLRTGTPYYALGVSARGVTGVLVREPYKAESRGSEFQTTGTHVILSVNLGGQQKRTGHK